MKLKTFHPTMLLLLWVLSPPSCLCAQAQSSHPEDSILSVDGIVELVQAGLSEDLIIAKIRQNGKAFDLGVDELLRLKKASVSDSIIKAMMQPERPVQSGEAVDPTAPPSREVGVYYKKRGEWLEVLPDIITWKTGGVLKAVATVGVVKRNINGRILGPHSRNSLTAPLEFLIRTGEGTAITEYQLLRLREKKKAREFRTVTGGVFHQSGGATRDLLPFESKKITNRTYGIILPQLGAGEYGFLPPGAFASSTAASVGKMYTFRVIE